MPPVELEKTIPTGEKIRVMPESTEEKDPFDLKNKRLNMIMRMLKNIRNDTFFIDLEFRILYFESRMGIGNLK